VRFMSGILAPVVARNKWKENYKWRMLQLAGFISCKH
jgi:hypothetical protein